MLIRKVGEKVANHDNSKVLFSWFILNKLGFDTKIGYFNNDIFLLVPTRQPIYEITYFKFNKVKYYAINTAETKKSIKQLYTYKGKYPGAINKFDLSLNKLPLILRRDPKAGPECQCLCRARCGVGRNGWWGEFRANQRIQPTVQRAN